MKLIVVVLVLAGALRAPVEQSPNVMMSLAIDAFEKGRFAEAATAFDAVAKAVPDRAPQLWQRGIALYYAGRYDDCRRQFESHRTVNPDDVENAVWHFLCVARGESPAKAKAALLPVGPDARVPMREVYEMFRGTLTPIFRTAASPSRSRDSTPSSPARPSMRRTCGSAASRCTTSAATATAARNSSPTEP